MNNNVVIKSKKRRAWTENEIKHVEKNLDLRKLSFHDQLSSYFKAISYPFSIGPLKDVEFGTQTVTGSIYTLISTSIGTGVLGLPYSFYQSGIIISTCLLMMGAYCAYWTMRVLMDVAFKVKKNNYAHLVDEILGKRWGVFLHVIFILTTYGIMIICMI